MLSPVFSFIFPVPDTLAKVSSAIADIFNSVLLKGTSSKVYSVLSLLKSVIVSLSTFKSFKFAFIFLLFSIYKVYVFSSSFSAFTTISILLLPKSKLNLLLKSVVITAFPVSSTVADTSTLLVVPGTVIL